MSKFCPNCGRKISDSAAFCEGCGTPLGGQPQQAYQPQQQYQQPVYTQPGQGGEAWRQNATADENLLVQGRKVSQNVYLGDDGKYRWVYELNLKKDVTMRRYVLKFFTYIMLIFLIPFLLVLLFTGSGAVIGKAFLVILGCAAFIYVCIYVGMGLYALVYKGSYWNIFEMDDQKITQKQMKQTADRTQILSLLILLGSQDAGTVSYVAAGGIATRYECPFMSITAVKLDQKHDLIDCSRVMGFCPVYAEPEDYNFIVNHILNHVPEKTAEKFRKKG